jgi:hypothetical protein
MKLTTARLKEIIKEEIRKTLGDTSVSWGGLYAPEPEENVPEEETRPEEEETRPECEEAIAAAQNIGREIGRGEWSDITQTYRLDPRLRMQWQETYPDCKYDVDFQKEVVTGAEEKQGSSPQWTQRRDGRWIRI